MATERGMGLAFAAGATCFLVGPLPGYINLVGPQADAVTFFIGSLFFTVGGALQLAVAHGRAAWWSAAIQSGGTLFFNISTFHALATTLSNPHYNRLVWRPDARGSVCFLVSGVIAYVASPRHRWFPARGGALWWQPAVNLLGCVFFGISAVAGYVVPATGTMLDLAAANWNTSLGAACFLACAVGTLRAPSVVHDTTDAQPVLLAKE